MKTILAAVDGSERSLGVVDTAVALGRATGAGVVLLHAVSVPAELPPAAFRMSPGEVAELVRSESEKQLNTLATRIPEAHRRGVRVEFGTPWEVIERVAEASDADLVVVGSHGYTGIDRLLGTTAAKVVNHATRSVLVVRAPERLTRGGSGSS